MAPLTRHVLGRPALKVTVNSGTRACATGLLSAPQGKPAAAVVVAADLNEGPEAATTQILSGPPGSEIGTGGFKQPDAGDQQRLWNLAGPHPRRVQVLAQLPRQR